MDIASKHRPRIVAMTAVVAVSALLASPPTPASAQPPARATSKRSPPTPARAPSADHGSLLPALSGGEGSALGGGSSCDWAEGFHLPGLDRTVLASVVFNDGTGDALYVGGRFSTAGGVLANGVAEWDGTKWSALGAGIRGTVRALTVFNNGGGPALYAGGEFTTAGGVEANGLAKWDGTKWSALGTGISGVVDALTVYDDGTGPALYAGGYLFIANDFSASKIAKWDGTNWSALGSGLNYVVLALTVFDDGGGPALYAGGWFTTAGGISARYIAKWDGTAWSALGTGMNQGVRVLAVYDDGGGPALYVGGEFTTAGGVPVKYIAQWDGNAWSAIGTGEDFNFNNSAHAVYALTLIDDGGGPALYAGGTFTATGGVPAKFVAKWDGTNWSALGTGTNNYVHTLKVFDDGGGPALYAGGSFTTAGGTIGSRVAKWDGSAWFALGTGAALNGNVKAIAVFDDGGGPALYGCGSFTSAVGVTLNGVAKWEVNAWSALGIGVNAPLVQALAVFDDGGGPALYAGGFFGTAGGVDADRVAKWDGNAWSALDSGMKAFSAASVAALAVFDDGGGPALYAGGWFTTAGGVSARNIAKWDGTSWSALGSGLDNVVLALTVFDDGGGPALYAAGFFRWAGGVFVNHVAKWDGATWSSLGAGVNRGVYALTAFDDGGGPALYAGGNFIAAGGVDANYIAKWDGGAWSALGTGMGGTAYPWVYALTVFDDGAGPALYAGGNFTAAGGVDANYIAKWDGTNWSPLGIGMHPDGYATVNALTVYDDGGGPALYAGGNFTIAGGKVSAYLAKWQCSDCNGNGVFDGNDLENCEGSAWCDDCDGNGRLDRCDISGEASSDANGNGIPDECECPPIAGAPAGARAVEMIDAAGTPWTVTANRFLIFGAGEPGRSQAIRVTPVDLPPPFDDWNGLSQWVSAPSAVSESAGAIDPADGPRGFPAFQAARLECTDTPHCMDWSTVGPIHVFGESIVPSHAKSSPRGDVKIEVVEALYDIQVIDCVCDAATAASYSAPLTFGAPVWGDTVLDLGEDPPLPPSSPQVDVTDSLAIIERFANAPGAISKARADLDPGCVDLLINVSDVLASLAGFAGMPYPFTPSAGDPCEPTCPNPLPRTNHPSLGPFLRRSR